MTSDLDEFAIASLAAAPVDGYGVGTQLVTGSGHPTSGFVYKLVAREGADGELVPVAKRSTDKTSVGGRKYALRRRSAAGVAEAEVIGIGTRPRTTATTGRCWCRWCEPARSSAGSRCAEARARHAPSRAELPVAVQQMSRGEPVIPTIHADR